MDGTAIDCCGSGSSDLLFAPRSGAKYAIFISIASNADAIIFAPYVPDFRSEKMKCLNFFPYFFSSSLSNFLIFSNNAFNFGEFFSMSFRKTSLSNSSLSNLYLFDVLIQFDFFLTHSGLKTS